MRRLVRVPVWPHAVTEHASSAPHADQPPSIGHVADEHGVVLVAAEAEMATRRPLCLCPVQRLPTKSVELQIAREGCRLHATTNKENEFTIN